MTTGMQRRRSGKRLGSIPQSIFQELTRMHESREAERVTKEAKCPS